MSGPGARPAPPTVLSRPPLRYGAAVRALHPSSLALVGLLLSSAAHARGYRIDQVPGGHTFECYMCHYRQPFTRLTVFGRDVRDHLLFREDYPEELPIGFFVGEEGNADWAALALLDSDGDGYTNGEELGDPEGVFYFLDPQPDWPFTRPDLPDDFPCGSGTVEGPEACDGDAFAGATCADFGFPGGALACRADCTIDPSGCTPCGDGVLDPGEQCDGPVDAVCGPGLVGEVRCVECRLDDSDCMLPPDAALPDAALPDAALPDAALPDAALPDAQLEPDGMPDAAVDDAAADAVADAVADAFDRGPPDATPAVDDGAGDAAPPIDGPPDVFARDPGPTLDAALDGPLDDAPPDPGAMGDCRLDPTRRGGGPWALLLLVLGRLLLTRRG